MSNTCYRYLFFLGILVFLIFLNMPNFSFFDCASWGCSTSLILWKIWDKWLWKKFAGKSNIPINIQGTWTGSLTSSYKCEEKKVKVIITQSFSKTKIELKTDQITSTSVCSYWESDTSFPRLYYIYKTQNLGIPNTSNIPQNGLGIICVENSVKMSIDYVTSSLTKGTIHLVKIGHK